MHYRVPRPPSDFPWYKPGDTVWLEGDAALTCTPGAGWSRPGGLSGGLALCSGNDNDGDQEQHNRGPLANIPCLVYLGTEKASKLWPGSDGEETELAF